MQRERLLLTEYQTTECALVAADAEFVRTELDQRIAISPSFVAGRYALNPGPHVGVVVLPSGLRVECRPKVPVSNVLYMLCVVGGLPTEQRPEVQPFDSLDALFEYVADYFAGLVAARIDAGLHRAYVETAENLTVVRGRIDFQEDIRRNHVLRHKVFCKYAELTWDIPDNQVIRQVCGLLAGSPFSADLRRRFRLLDRELGELTLTRFRAEDVRGFNYDRFNEAYRQLHYLCALFLEGRSLSEDIGDVESRTFLIDMNQLFESFVTEVLTSRLGGGLTVRAQSSTPLDVSRSVTVRPDLVLISGSSAALVADCKYKQLDSQVSSQADIYQLLAYCHALRCDNACLIYPRSGQMGELNWEIQVVHDGPRLSAIALDLSVPASQLNAECDKLAARVSSLIPASAG